jgi:ribosomal-protein-alanine N-acetyltransferase
MVGGDPNTLPPLTRDEVNRWYDRITTEPYHWGIEWEGRLIGTTCLHSLDETNHRARYAIGIFDPACWNKGFGTETTRLILKYAFDSLCLHRIDLRVLSFNQRAIACYEKCGFVREGVEREGALIGGEWQSDVLMSILEAEYRAVSETWFPFV